jgi:multimeric flavodoxin WrbA
MHDLSESQFKQIVPSINQETTVIADNGKIRACIGCYGCWLKTPGVCVLKDGYQNFGQLYAKTNEMIVISKCVYGSYSPFIKNVWDRSISYVLPYFVKINNETHHKLRYNNKFDLKVYFYGDTTEIERDTAQKLIKANCVSFGVNPLIHFHNTVEEMEGITL